MSETIKKAKLRLQKTNQRFVEATQQLRDLEKREEDADQQRREAERNADAAKRRLNQSQIEWEHMEKVREEIASKWKKVVKDEGFITTTVAEYEYSALCEEKRAEDQEKKNKRTEKSLGLLKDKKAKCVKEVQKLENKRKETLWKQKQVEKQQERAQERFERAEYKKKKGAEKLQKRKNDEKALRQQKDMGPKKGSQKVPKRLQGATKNEKKGQPAKDQNQK